MAKLVMRDVHVVATSAPIGTRRQSSTADKIKSGELPTRNTLTSPILGKVLWSGLKVSAAGRRCCPFLQIASAQVCVRMAATVPQTTATL
jgi:hypothetical protein